jgi:hypothetical protein
MSTQQRSFLSSITSLFATKQSQTTGQQSTTNTVSGLPSSDVFDYGTQNRMFVIHDALSDHIVAPYGRLAGLRTQQLGVSTYRNQRRNKANCKYVYSMKIEVRLGDADVDRT